MAAPSSKGSVITGCHQHASGSIGVERKSQNRREKNRIAQRRFRQRRKVTENQQGHRLEVLEDALHETLSLYLGLSDVVLGVEAFSAGYPHLLNGLQRSMTRILEIAKIVNHSGIIPTASYTGPPDEAAQKGWQGPVPEIASKELSPSLPNRGSSLPKLSTMGIDQPSNFPEQRTVNSVETDGYNQRDFTKPDLQLPTPPRENVDLQPQLRYKPPSPQCQQLMEKLNFFASRLVELAISRAYSVLLGTLSVSSDDVHRIFGSTLRIRTREQILVDLRWLLGPGKKALPQASGYLWGYASQNDALPRWAYYSSLDGICLEVAPNKSSETNHQSSVCQPKLLTTLGVVQELSELRARVIDGDILEITLGDQRLFDSNLSLQTKRSDECGINDLTLSPSSNDNFLNPSIESLKLRLSIPLLIVNLALIAICSKVGPVYESSEIAKAVESSIITIVKNE